MRWSRVMCNKRGSQRWVIHICCLKPVKLSLSNFDKMWNSVWRSPASLSSTARNYLQLWKAKKWILPRCCTHQKAISYSEDGELSVWKLTGYGIVGRFECKFTKVFGPIYTRVYLKVFPLLLFSHLALHFANKAQKPEMKTQKYLHCLIGKTLLKGFLS